ncbi:TniB family NTP-binding protein [Brevibacillus laterosporus]|uniref:TniB family NTP-binding protein n=1 Tax=Brevibacillus laterosporus TaxID=1465 RepID=UPI000839C971|nr:TniB family NTP-binding protein [Brevibacillus laterosporus]
MEKFEKLNGKPIEKNDYYGRIEHVKNIVIKHPKFKSLLEIIAECHEGSIGSSLPENLFLYGYTGTGKSTLLRDEYLSKYPRQVLPDITSVPVVYLRVPVGATVKSVASAILNSLGDPLFDKGTETQLTARIHYFFEKCDVQFVIIDEFQHLIDKDTQKVLRKASDWLKVFAEESNTGVLLCGLPESEKIFMSNEQLDSRFERKETLEPFYYETYEQQKEFRSFLNTFDKQLPFPEQSYIAEARIAEKIFYISNGVPRYIKNLLKEATKVALKDSQDKIIELHLGQAFEKNIRSTRPFLINPFNVKTFNLEEALAAEEKAAKVAKKGFGKKLS